MLNRVQCRLRGDCIQEHLTIEGRGGGASFRVISGMTTQLPDGRAATSFRAIRDGWHQVLTQDSGRIPIRAANPA